MTNPTTYLALGDSYTIGEGVPLHESFPYQVVQLARAAGKRVYGPEIIAKTGWTTAELASHIDHTRLNDVYSAVSLLIGVNNQYRGLPAPAYEVEFRELLERSISLAGNDRSKVFVLSIPDWGRTIFARGRDTNKIALEIAAFNTINRRITEERGASYIDITDASPESYHDTSFLAADGLHPSGKAYKRWAELLAKQLIQVI